MCMRVEILQVQFQELLTSLESVSLAPMAFLFKRGDVNLVDFRDTTSVYSALALYSAGATYTFHQCCCAGETPMV